MLAPAPTVVPRLSMPAIMAGRSPLSDNLRRARLRGFLDREAHERGWWAVLLLEDGSMFETCSTPIDGMQFGYSPDGERKTFARDLCRTLNKEAHYGGVWAVVWFRRGNRFALVWKDWDGDVQVFADESTPFSKFKNISMHHWARHGDEMVRVWLTTMLQELDMRPEETVKLAAGEMPTVAMAPEELEDKVGGVLEGLS